MVQSPYFVRERKPMKNHQMRYQPLIPSILAFVLCLIFVFSFPHKMAHAGPQDYSYEYSSTNFYANYGLEYSFTGLDSATEYTWTVQQLSLTGTILGTLYSVTQSGVTTFDWTIPVFEEIFAPLRVVDNFGNILSYHFVHPTVQNTPYNLTNSPASAHNAEDKTVVFSVGTVPFASNFYTGSNDSTSLTAHPRDFHQMVTAQSGNYLILHYHLPPAYVTGAVTTIRNVSTGALVYTIDQDELVGYQNNKAGFEPYGLNNFVVLTTDGVVPPFISSYFDSLAFPTQSPHRTTFAQGIYDYARIYAGPTTVVGESVFMVTDSATDTEWRLRPIVPRVPTTKNVRIELRSETTGIWAGYGNQTVYDSIVSPATDVFGGLLSSVFAASHRTSYATGAVGVSTLEFNAKHGAVLSYGQADVYGFRVRSTYESISFLGPIDRGIGILEGTDSFEVFDKLLIMLVCTVFAFGALVAIHAPAGAYGMVYAAIGSGFLFLGWFDLQYGIMIGASVMVALAISFKLGFSSEG